MPEEITAQYTREIVSWLIEEFDDNKRVFLKTNGQIFTKLNEAQKQIARITRCLKEDCYVILEPNKVYYSLAELPVVIADIVQIENVVIVDSDNTESKPLDYRNRPTFERHIKTDTSITTPMYYGIDNVQFYYWKPYQTAGYRVLIRCSKIPHLDERISATIDPILPMPKYYDLLKYKTAVLTTMSNKTLRDLTAGYSLLYEAELESIQLTLKTLDSHEQTYAGRF